MSPSSLETGRLRSDAEAVGQIGGSQDGHDPREHHVGALAWRGPAARGAGAVPLRNAGGIDRTRSRRSIGDAGDLDPWRAAERLFVAAGGSRDRLSRARLVLSERLHVRSDDSEATLALRIVERALAKAPYPDGPWRWQRELSPARIRAANRRRVKATRRAERARNLRRRATWRSSHLGVEEAPFGRGVERPASRSAPEPARRGSAWRRRPFGVNGVEIEEAIEMRIRASCHACDRLFSSCARSTPGRPIAVPIVPSSLGCGARWPCGRSRRWRPYRIVGGPGPSPSELHCPRRQCAATGGGGRERPHGPVCRRAPVTLTPWWKRLRAAA